MTRFLLITLTIGIIFITSISGYFLIYRNNNYCSRFSGSAGYMEGETLAKECESAGCKVINKRTFSSTSKTKACDYSTGVADCTEIEMPELDSGGYRFECVSLININKD